MPPAKHCCDICGKEFSTMSNLFKHKRNVHRDKHLFKCNKCNAEFGNKAILHNHKRVYHSKNTPGQAESSSSPNLMESLDTLQELINKGNCLITTGVNIALFVCFMQSHVLPVFSGSAYW